MHDFGKLVYLDLQKTGSTFVSRFLNETCVRAARKEIKHGRIYFLDYKRRAFYFITVRHPVSQYSSLFRYGLDGRGGLYERLTRVGKADLYKNDAESFNRWLRFILDFQNAALLGEGYDNVPTNYDLGFLSFRYLMLSMVRPEKTLLQKPDTVALEQYVKQRSIVNHVIQNERLNEGLLDLATNIKPEYFDQTKVREFFKNPHRVNVSRTEDNAVNDIENDVYALIMKKERILMDCYRRLEPTLPDFLNKGERSRQYMENQNDRTASRVCDLYADDIEMLGYRFDTTKSS